MNSNIKWLFFDIGSTVVDESLCYEDRYKKLLLEHLFHVRDFEKR